MIIPLDDLLVYDGNRYEFTCGSMSAIDKIQNMKKFQEDPNSWKVVPTILRYSLEGSLNFDYKEDEKTESAGDEPEEPVVEGS
jgi:hypothetical protein